MRMAYTYKSIGKDIKTLQEVYGKVNKNCKIDLNRRPTNVDQTNFSSPTAGSSSVLPCTSALVMTSPSKILYKELFGSDCESSSCDEDASPLPSTSGLTELKRLKLPKTKQQKSGHNNVKGKQIKMCQPQPKKTKAIKKISGNRNGNWPEYWDFFLWKPSNREQVAPVHFFKHAPFANNWNEFATVGLIIEAINPYAKLRDQEAYWIATIQEFAGYRALIEYERFDDPTKEMAWIPFCSDVPKPLGFADRSRINVKLLRPSADLVERYPDFMDLARDKLIDKTIHQGVITLQEKHAKTVLDAIQEKQIYKLGTKLEVIDMNCFERNQVATVTGVIGDRIHVTYGLPKKATKYDLGHFLNVKSEHVHPLGWSNQIGQRLYATQEDTELATGQILPESPFSVTYDFLKVGMHLEVRHPKFPSQIAPAVISEVFRYGYFMAEVKAYQAKDGCKMCFHITSPLIFECGFAQSNEIEFPESDGSGSCTWETYYQLSYSIFLDLSSVLSRNNRSHQFEVGMKIETVDLCVPNTIRPATVVKVAEHLLRLHFDGRAKEFDQWCDAGSTDIYPLGWAEMVGHKFSGYPEAAIPVAPFLPKIISVRTVETNEHDSIEPHSTSDNCCVDAMLEGIELSEILDYEYDESFID